MRRWAWVALGLLGAGCMTMAPEQKLAHEIFVEAASECESRFHTIHVDQIDLDGDLKIHTDAESHIQFRAFVSCYHESLKARADARRKAGQPVPEGLMREHDVED